MHLTKHIERRRLRGGLVGATALGVLAASLAAGSGFANAASGFTKPTFVRTIGHPGDAYVYPWGMATETVGPYAGDIVVGDYNNYNVKIFTPSGTLAHQFGSRGKALGQFGQPYGLALDPNDGSIYVADLNNKRIEKFSNAGVALYTVAPPGAYYAPYVAVNSLGDLFIVQSLGLYSGSPNTIYEYDSKGNALTAFGTTGTSCSSGQFGLIRGVDVDAADNLYVDDVQNHCVQVFNTKTTANTFVRSFGNKSQLSSNTRDLGIDRVHGIVYVSDAQNEDVAEFTTAGNYLGTIGTPGTDPGDLAGPRGVTVGTDGTVYVGDYTNWWVNAYGSPTSSTPGAYLRSIPPTPIPPPAGGFNNPTAVAVSSFAGTSGDVYVADTFNQRIQQFTNNGTWLNMWGARLPQLNGPYALDYPRGVAVDPSNGNVWVNDTRSGYIKEYSSNGTFISEFGGPGGAVGQFLYAIGIAVGPNGNIYVPDSANDRLQELTQSGHEVAGFPVPCGSGLGYGGYTGCTGVAVDAAGNIYAAAPGNSVVYVFNASGHQIGTIGSTAPGGKLADPWDVALSGTTLYVTEATGNRVSAFNVASPAGPYPYLGNWGKAGTANGDLNRPLGITVDASGDIYVVDYTNARIEVFKP